MPSGYKMAVVVWHSTAQRWGVGMHTQYFRSTFHYRRAHLFSIGIPWEAWKRYFTAGSQYRTIPVLDRYNNIALVIG